MIKDFKEALEKELGCSVKVEIYVYGNSHEEATDVAKKLEQMISEIETDVHTDRYSKDNSEWLSVHKNGSYIGNRAVVFLPYPALEEQAI